MATARGRVLGDRDRGRHARRVSRPARIPPAHARSTRRRLGGRVRDVRARPHRRRGRPRRATGRGRLDRLRGAARRAGRPRRAERALHLRARLLRAARLAGRRRRGARRARADGRAARARRRPPTRTWSSASRTAARLPRSASRKASGIPYNEALIKNRYVARTFIQPEQGMREQGIRMKFNPLDEVAGKRIVVVDDSIVRGNTTRQLVADAVRRRRGRGARARVVAAGRLAVLLRDRHGRRGPARRRAPLGRGDARAHRRDVAPLPLGRGHAGRRPQLPEDSVCRACFTREYPTRVPPKVAKLRFEPAPA